MNTECGSWSQYQDSCTLYPITLSFDTRIRLKWSHLLPVKFRIATGPFEDVQRSSMICWSGGLLNKRWKSSWKCNIWYRTILSREKWIREQPNYYHLKHNCNNSCLNWTINYDKLIKLFIYTKCVYLNTGGIIYSIHG